MFIYHGWIEIEHQGHLLEMAKGKIDYTEYRRRLLAVTNELESIADNSFDIPEIDLKVMLGTNGIITVHLSGSRNHFHDGIERMLAWIKENAPMSHGLIYQRDDEIAQYENRYWVLRLAKNSIKELTDVYLSPNDEVIENKIE